MASGAPPSSAGGGSGSSIDEGLRMVGEFRGDHQSRARSVLALANLVGTLEMADRRRLLQALQDLGKEVFAAIPPDQISAIQTEADSLDAMRLIDLFSLYALIIGHLEEGSRGEWIAALEEGLRSPCRPVALSCVDLFEGIGPLLDEKEQSALAGGARKRKQTAAPVGNEILPEAPPASGGGGGAGSGGRLAEALRAVAEMKDPNWWRRAWTREGLVRVAGRLDLQDRGQLVAAVHTLLEERLSQLPPEPRWSRSWRHEDLEIRVLTGLVQLLAELIPSLPLQDRFTWFLVLEGYLESPVWYVALRAGDGLSSIFSHLEPDDQKKGVQRLIESRRGSFGLDAHILALQVVCTHLRFLDPDFIKGLESFAESELASGDFRIRMMAPYLVRVTASRLPAEARQDKALMILGGVNDPERDVRVASFMEALALLPDLPEEDRPAVIERVIQALQKSPKEFEANFFFGLEKIAALLDPASLALFAPTVEEAVSHPDMGIRKIAIGLRRRFFGRTV